MDESTGQEKHTLLDEESGTKYYWNPNNDSEEEEISK